MKKWIVILVIVLVGGLWAWKKAPEWRMKSEVAGVDRRPKEAVAEQRDIRFSVPAAGEIGPAEQVSVKPEINGRIEALPVDIGDEVKRGDMLFKLDDKELQNEKASIETEVERATLQLQQAERNFARAQELFDLNLIARELFETSKTEFDLAKNALERTKRNRDIVDERLTKTRVVAPFDSTILTRPVSIGQAVSGSGGFNSGTEVLTIADLNNLVINAHINQADITRLKPNQEVDVTVEAVPGLSVVGVVERMAPQATIKNNIKGFAVRILLKDVDKRIRPGMTANINIPVASAENVVAVPLAAVFTETDPESYKTERYVLVKNGVQYEKRIVQLGVSDFFYAEIQKGLKPGETIALEPPQGQVEMSPKIAQQRGRGGQSPGTKAASTVGTSTNQAPAASATTPSPAKSSGAAAPTT